MKFSILVATYNHEQFILSTISTCLNQNYDDYEVIVSDDCSTDATYEIIKKISNPKLTIYRQDKNIGEYNNRNFLLNIAKGEFVIYIDGEDLIYSHALCNISGYIELFPNSQILIARSWEEKYPHPNFINPLLFAKNNFLGFGLTALNFTGLIIKRSTLLSLGGFDNNNIKIGDLYIQLKIGLKYGALIIPDGFSWWRRRKGQASESLLNDGFLYFQQLLLFWPQFVNSSNLLSNNDKERSLINFYGNILRFCFRSMFKLNFLKVIIFLRSNKIPFKYYKSIFIKPFYSYYS